MNTTLSDSPLSPATTIPNTDPNTDPTNDLTTDPTELTGRPDPDLTEDQPLRRTGSAALRPGTHVEVRRRFDDAWAHGFQVHAAHTDGYQLRRLTDGAILPVAFPASDLRRSTEPT